MTYKQLSKILKVFYKTVRDYNKLPLNDYHLPKVSNETVIKIKNVLRSNYEWMREPDTISVSYNGGIELTWKYKIETQGFNTYLTVIPNGTLQYNCSNFGTVIPSSPDALNLPGLVIKSMTDYERL